MSYFYHPDLSLGAEFALCDEESRHMTKTLRMKAGTVIDVLDGKGGVAKAELLSVPERRGQATARVLEFKTVLKPKTRVHLYVCPPRNNLLTQIIRQSTELGVASIQLMESEYTMSRPKDKNLAEWERAALAACKQSGNAFLPEFPSVKSFSAALAACELPSYYGAVPEDADKLNRADDSPEDLAIWIGPEGGFSAAELAALKESGAKGICLGTWILRVETAVVAMMSQFV